MKKRIQLTLVATVVFLVSTAVLFFFRTFKPAQYHRAIALPPLMDKASYPPDHQALADSKSENLASQIDPQASPPSPAKPQTTLLTHKIRQGDTLARSFQHYGIHGDSLQAVIRCPGFQPHLKHLKTGYVLSLLKNNAHQLLKLTYNLSADKQLILTRASGKQPFKQEIKTLPSSVRERYTTFAIKHSLFGTSAKHKVPYTLMKQVIHQFAWDIDFSRHIQPQDRLSLVYEERMREGQVIGHGRLLAASMTHRDKHYSIVLNTLDSKSNHYYTAEGFSVQQRFLRAPVKYTHISSHFNLARHHPLLHRIRAHKGVDYAAKQGTPIMATGDGRIVFKGWKGGYGRLVQIDHGQTYSTLYAHMSKFNDALRQGTQVRQGNVIGYVGATGLATAPHVHYEFHVKGQHVDPVKMVLPRANPMTGAQRMAFLKLAREKMGAMKRYELASLSPTTQSSKRSA